MSYKHFINKFTEKESEIEFWLLGQGQSGLR